MNNIKVENTLILPPEHLQTVTDRINEILKEPKHIEKYQSFSNKDEADNWIIMIALATLIVPVEKRRVIPKAGDVILLKNVPDKFKETSRLIADHELNKESYRNREVIVNFKHHLDYGFFVDNYGAWREDKNIIGGFNLYIPYKTDQEFSVSGSGNNCHISDLTFLKKDIAPYWYFYNGIRRAGNGFIEFHEVNFFELDYENLR